MADGAQTQEVAVREQSAGMTDTDFTAKVRLAKQFPRDLKRVLAQALEELEVAPEFAARAYYSIPYKEYRDGQEKTVLVEGPSVKASKALTCHWGNCADGARIAEQDDERVLVEGVFHDYQTNVTTVRQVAVSRKRYDKRTKQMVPLRDDRLVMAIQAGASKAVRNAILSGLPVWLVEAYFAKAKKLAIGLKGDKDKLAPKDIKRAVEAMVKAFAKLGVDGDRLSAYMKDKLDAELSDEEKLAQMRGIFTAISEGQTTVAEVFGGAPGETETPETAAGPVSMEGLLGKKQSRETPPEEGQ